MAAGESAPEMSIDPEAESRDALQGFLYLANANPWLVHAAVGLCSRPQDMPAVLEFIDTYPEGLEALRLTSQMLEEGTDRSIMFDGSTEAALGNDPQHKVFVREHRKNPTPENTFAVRVSRINFGLRGLMRNAVLADDEPYTPRAELAS